MTVISMLFTLMGKGKIWKKKTNTNHNAKHGNIEGKKNKGNAKKKELNEKTISSWSTKQWTEYGTRNNHWAWSNVSRDFVI